MLIRLIVPVVLVFVTLVAMPTTSRALTCGTWVEAEKSLRSWWGKAYPNEKILSAEQNGPPQTYSKIKSTNQKKIDEYGNEWEYYQKNPYCSIPAKVKVQQSSGPRIFNVSAVFKVSGKKFTFDDVAVGGSEAVLEPGMAAAPDVAEIKKLIVEKVISKIPPQLQGNIKVDKVMISPRQFQRWEGGTSAYSMSSVDLYLVVDGENQSKCEIAPVNLFKGEEKNMRLDADGTWQIQIVSKSVPSSCVPFKYSDQTYKYANNIVEQAPPAVDTSWMKNVVGVYKGDIQADVYNAVTTILTMDKDGKLSGTFDYKERNKQISGTISDCTATKVNEVKCNWKDQDDKGGLRFTFNKNNLSFKGRWWDKVEHRANSWDGTKTSGPVPSTGGDSKPSDSAPAPSINKLLKGFGF